MVRLLLALSAAPASPRPRHARWFSGPPSAAADRALAELHVAKCVAAHARARTAMLRPARSSGPSSPPPDAPSLVSLVHAREGDVDVMGGEWQPSAFAHMMKDEFVLRLPARSIALHERLPRRFFDIGDEGSVSSDCDSDDSDEDDDFDEDDEMLSVAWQQVGAAVYAVVCEADEAPSVALYVLGQLLRALETYHKRPGISATLEDIFRSPEAFVMLVDVLLPAGVLLAATPHYVDFARRDIESALGANK